MNKWEARNEGSIAESLLLVSCRSHGNKDALMVRKTAKEETALRKMLLSPSLLLLGFFKGEMCYRVYRVKNRSSGRGPWTKIFSPILKKQIFTIHTLKGKHFPIPCMYFFVKRAQLTP